MGKLWLRVARKLDKLSDFSVNIYADLREVTSKGWKENNESRINELKLMFRAFNRSPLGVFGAVLVIIFIFVGVFGPYIAPESYANIYHYPVNAPPGYHGGLPLGADHYGRDLLSILLYGFRVSMVISFVVVSIGAPLGVLLGLISGYYGGAVDETIMRFTDIFYAFPALVLAMAFAAVLPERMTSIVNSVPLLRDTLVAIFGIRQADAGNLGPMLSIIFAMVLVWWPGYARMTRALVLSVKENVYVEAAKALGLSNMQVMRKHILPNIMSIVLVMVTIDLGSIIILEAALSYFGLGAQPPVPEIGRIIYDMAAYLPDVWWGVVYPGLALFIVGLGWNLLGDVLRDVVDPRARRSIEFGITEEEIYLDDILGISGYLVVLIGLVIAGYMSLDVVGLTILLVIISLQVIVWKTINVVRPLSKFKVGEIASIIVYYWAIFELWGYMEKLFFGATIVIAGIILVMISNMLKDRRRKA